MHLSCTDYFFFRTLYLVACLFCIEVIIGHGRCTGQYGGSGLLISDGYH
jgi:hypothetical protein